MSGAYDQQIKKLVDHIQQLNQALHERNMQIVQWQQIARAVQDERVRVARSLMDQVRTGLSGFQANFRGLKDENAKLRTYVDHQRQLHEVVARDLQGQLKYALSRIDELARERGEWRKEVDTTRQAAIAYQGEAQAQKGVIASQQAALSDLKVQLEQAMRFKEQEDRFLQEMAHLERELETAKTQLATTDQNLVVKDRELRRLNETYEAFKLKANEEVQALAAELREAKAATTGVDERVDEMTSLLANSEREVAKLFKELQEERTLRKEAEFRLDAQAKELRAAKTKATKLEKEVATAKGQKLADIQKELEETRKLNEQMREKLEQMEADKTQYMQAVEGQKPKLRPLPPSGEQST
jgi:chromosome segregation ATPase